MSKLVALLLFGAMSAIASNSIEKVSLHIVHNPGERAVVAKVGDFIRFELNTPPSIEVQEPYSLQVGLIDNHESLVIKDQLSRQERRPAPASSPGRTEKWQRFVVYLKATKQGNPVVRLKLMKLKDKNDLIGEVFLEQIQAVEIR